MGELSHIEGLSEFVPWRAQLDRTKSGAKLLDTLISPRNARALVRALPSDDLHSMIRRIGLGDCSELLALASGEQFRDILDGEVWVGDQLSIERADAWMEALVQAGHDVLVQRVMALDDEVINWLVRRTVRVVVVEDPDGFEPEDYEHVVTPDNRLCVYFPDSAPRDLPVKLLLDGLMRMNTTYCVDLLIHAEAALDANLQEAAYRWRCARMADRGYVDYYEALAVYTRPRADVSKGQVTVTGYVPTRWMVPLVEPEVRLGDAVATLDGESLERVQASLGYVANMALSADRIEPWDIEAQDSVLRRVRAGLVLGLEQLAGPESNPERDGQILAEHSLTTIFRTGYGRMLDAVAPLVKVRSALRIGPDPVGAVDLAALRPWAEALTGRHPARLDGRPLTSAADLADARTAAETLATLCRAAAPDRHVERGLGQSLLTALVRDLLGIEGHGPLPGDRIVDAHRALFVDGAVRPEAVEAAHAWWGRRDGGGTRGLETLLAAAADAMAQVAEDHLEPRFLPLLWIG